MGFCRHWQSRFEDSELQQVGAEWIGRGSSAILMVPSAVFPQERNIMINPQHRDFEKIVVCPAEPFVFDARLRKSGAPPRVQGGSRASIQARGFSRTRRAM